MGLSIAASLSSKRLIRKISSVVLLRIAKNFISSKDMMNFHRDVPYTMEIDGSCMGKAFTIHAEGVGNSSTGKIAGTYTCTSGVLPMSWIALSTTFQYGFKVFGRTSSTVSYYQQCMYNAGGYAMDRRLRLFNDGEITSKHTVEMKDGVVMAKVSLNAEGFRDDSPVLHGLAEVVPSKQVTTPQKNGMMSLTNQLYKTSCGKPVAAVLESFDYPLNNADVPRETLVISAITVSQKVSGRKCYQEEIHNITNNCWLTEMGDTPYSIEIEGEIQGEIPEKFTIVGHGTGNPKTGKQRGTMNCTSGKMPMSWISLSAGFQYGFKVFAKLPSGVQNFYMACLKSGGYTMNRTLEFVDDGKIQADHTITMDGGMVRSKVKLTASGFKADSPVLGDLQELLESNQTAVRDQDGKGLRNITQQTYLTKSGEPVLPTLWSHDQHIGGANSAALEDHPEVLYSRIKLKQTVVEGTCHQEEDHCSDLTLNFL